MSVEKKNFDALKLKYPQLFDKLSAMKPSGRYQVINAGNGKHLNLIDHQRKVFYYDKFSPYSPVEKDIIGRQIKIPNLAIFLGCGLFYTAKAYLDNYINKTASGESRLYIIEKDIDSFRTVIQFVDISALILHDGIIFYVDTDPHSIMIDLSARFKQGGIKAFIKAMNFIEDLNSFTAYKDYYINCIRAVKEAAKDTLIFFGNSPLDSLIGIENTFLNIMEIIDNPGVKDLKGVFKGKPGIVVSTGPSLEKNIHLLKGLENKAVICSPDASLQVMRNHGFKPHMVTSLERGPATAKLFDYITPEDTDDVYFAATPVIHQNTYSKWHGKKIIVYRSFATFEWLEIEKGTLDIGPSAGNMAFELLDYLGCNPIILIGQDLAFGKDGNTHATGSRFGNKEDRPHFKDTLMVEGNYQPQIQTMRIWENFRRYFVADISKTSATVINATEGGAKIQGTQIMTFQEAIDKYIDDDVNALDIISGSLNQPDEKEKREYLEKTLEKVNTATDFTKDVQQKFYSAVLMCNEYFDVIWKNFQETGDYDGKRTKEILDSTSDIMAVCNSQDFYHILMHYVQSYYIKSVMDIYGVKANAKDGRSEQYEVLQVAAEFFETMHGLMSKILPMFEQLQRVLKGRLESGD
ncbi:protein of unknown function DUF115 [Denitrovibrio acetiphilus DSM 12809]|uniref:6-hydroxymethylpterin diphosphokinase MptE-like domain-containing protein n=1 Tax=Denitrovibrio acetiphilus (strain DSM 12809 / NBRC 114555 / N2460) TaxID=522772 RepID=D4H3G7_DENA2|nr:6-hydroxymethylpterin diphosphokinase MptE-like protein [Denitrovibrio acetiphilus]ADD67251.1 protein of unknown function DUF115 [Denitrovibrio acetiphilus DSM 12809]